ncbi:MAG: inositol monophosphatase family protein [Rickettsiales bacterium]
MFRDNIQQRNHGLKQSDVDHLFKTMIEAGRELAARRDEFASNYKPKNDGSPQTSGDLFVQDELKEALSKFEIKNKKGQKERCAIISEEHDADINIDIMQKADEEKKPVWVIDPIDGTQSYMENRKEYTINVALLSAPDATGNRTPVFGAVYAPAKNEFFFTGLDGKSYEATPKQEGFAIHSLFETRSKKQIKAADTVSDDVRVANGSEYEGGTDIFGDNVSTERHTGAYRTLIAARGEADAAIFNKSAAIWDVAAVDAIMRGAGGRAFPIKDGKVTGNELYYGNDAARYSNGNMLEAGPYISVNPKLFEALKIPTADDVLITLGSKGRA